MKRIHTLECKRFVLKLLSQKLLCPPSPATHSKHRKEGKKPSNPGKASNLHQEKRIEQLSTMLSYYCISSFYMVFIPVCSLFRVLFLLFGLFYITFLCIFLVHVIILLWQCSISLEFNHAPVIRYFSSLI